MPVHISGCPGIFCHKSIITRLSRFHRKATGRYCCGEERLTEVAKKTGKKLVISYLLGTILPGAFCGIESGIRETLVMGMNLNQQSKG